MLSVLLHERSHTDAHVEKRRKKLELYFKMFNGKTCSDASGATKLIHWTNTGETKEDLLEYAAKMLTATASRSPPRRLAMNKWTKLGPSLDFFWFISRNSLAFHLFNHAFSSLLLMVRDVPGEACFESGSTGTRASSVPPGPEVLVVCGGVLGWE